jgi:PAS domain-containing protein
MRTQEELSRQELRRLLQEPRRELVAERKRHTVWSESAPLAFLRLDPRGHILELNQQVAGLLRSSAEKLLQTPLDRWVAEWDRGSSGGTPATGLRR